MPVARTSEFWMHSIGLAELDAIEARMAFIGVRPDIAGYQDLALAFDLKTAALAAVQLPAALERRETRGCHNHGDYTETDAPLRANFAWSISTGVTREEIPPIPEEIAALMGARGRRAA